MLGIKWLFLLLLAIPKIRCQKRVVNREIYGDNAFCEAVRNGTGWKNCTDELKDDEEYEEDDSPPTVICEIGKEYCAYGSDDLGNGQLKDLNAYYCFPVLSGYYAQPYISCTIDDDCKNDDDDDTGKYCDQNFERGWALCATPIKSCKNGPSLTNRPCLDDWDCQKTHKTSKCQEIDDGRKTCCIAPEELGKTNCSTGFPIYPFEFCDDSSNPCSFASNETMKKWCDFESNICCEKRDDIVVEKESIYCPDQRTVLSAQSICKKDGEDDCEIGGNCWMGRCCPDVERTNATIITFENLPDKSFLTEVPCKFDQENSLEWIWTYCDQTLLKIVQIGKLNNFGEKIELANSTNCKKSTDCDTIYQENMVCILTDEMKSYCVMMPTLENLSKPVFTNFRPREYRLSTYIAYFVYIGLVGCAVLIVVCIADYCYVKSRKRLRV